jgi:hypothetical protein
MRYFSGPRGAGRAGVIHTRTVLYGALAAVAAVLTIPPQTAVSRSVEPPVPVLRWSGCGGGFDCATAAVPLDYDNPAGPKLSLSLIKLPATDQRHRAGRGR